MEISKAKMKMLSHKLVLVVIAVIVSICAANQSPLTFEEFLEFAKHSKGLPMSRILHISKRQVTRQSNPPRFGVSCFNSNVNRKILTSQISIISQLNIFTPNSFNIGLLVSFFFHRNTTIMSGIDESNLQ